MNERIVKLITKADTHAWSIADKYVARDCCHDGEVNYLWEDAFREKFAELMVRECAQLARDTDLEDVEGGDSDVLRAAKQQILEHFGVEE